MNDLERCRSRLPLHRYRAVRRGHQCRAVRASRPVLIPLNPTPADLRALVKGLPLVRKSGKPFQFVLTSVRPNLRNNDGAAVALDALGLVLATRMHERVIYAETFAHGKTALETDAKGVAAQEIAALWAMKGSERKEIGKREFMKERIL